MKIPTLSRRKLFILLYGSIFLVFSSIYIVHLIRVGIAASEIHQRELREEKKYNQLKAAIQSEFERRYPEQKYLFSELYQFEKSKRYIGKTTIRTCFFWNNLKKYDVDEGYLTCLDDHLNSKALEQRSEHDYEKALNELEKMHGKIVREWANKLGKHRFFEKIKSNGCSNYFRDSESHRFNENSIPDFDNFLTEFKKNKQIVENEKDLVRLNYEEEIARLRSGMTNKEKRIFDNQLKLNSPLHDGMKRFRYDGTVIGDFDYSIPSPVLDRLVLEDALAIVYNEQYKDYSLANGAMPYGYCYGRENSGNSSVRVNAGNSDVLVMIKNSKDMVVRHVFIQANNTFKLRMPNGKYTVYFYYGKGWNPKKKMKATYCGEVVGGFIYYEQLTKDPDMLLLFNDQMEYTLQTRSGGNFTPAPSSVDDAF
jgi:hypothetical protein